MKEENDYRCCRKTAAKVFIPLTVGGDIKCERYVQFTKSWGRQSFNKLSGSAKPEVNRRRAEHFGSQCIVVAIDARKVAEGKWNVYVNGGRVDTGMDAIEWAKRVVKLGAGEILLTSMDADGTKSGYDLRLTEEISKVFLFQSSHQEAVVIRIIL